jgi:hypothetical protein
VEGWQPIFPPHLLSQEKYQDRESSSYWRTKFRDNLREADRELLKGVRHLETLLGYYETEQATDDASYLEDFADRNEVPLDKVITTWGREDFDDSIDAADKILSNRIFRNLKTTMTDLRNAERMMSQAEAKEMVNAGYNEWLAMLPEDDWGDSFKNAVPVHASPFPYYNSSEDVADCQGAELYVEQLMREHPFSEELIDYHALILRQRGVDDGECIKLAREAESLFDGVRVAFFQGASDAEYALEELFLDLLPGTKFEDKVFAVGGYVRDELAGTEPNDLDIVVEAMYGAQRFADFLEDTFPEAVTEPEPLTLEYPIWHLTFTDDVTLDGKTYAVGGAELDIADTQTLTNGSTTFGPVEDDAARRDFTVNMLFKNLSSGEIVDPTGVGKMDLERGLLRGYPDADAMAAFADQPKRMLRLVRFQARYDWEVDPTIEEALRMSVDHLLDLDDETVLWEFGKLRKAGVFNEAWDLMREYGMLSVLKEVLYAGEEST